MNFTLRPSKTFSFDILERELRRHTSGIGLDAGSSHLRNRALFHTDTYYGLDIRKEDIEAGLVKFPDDTTWGIHADLCKLDKLSSNSIDVLVSTNTLYHLPKEKILKAIQELIRITKPDGTMIIELQLNREFDVQHEEFSKLFKDVRVIFYKNAISRAYENFFEKDGFLGSHPLAGTKPFLAFSWLLSRIEFLTCKFRKLNRHALIVAHQKSTPEKSNPFDLSNFPLSGRIYNAMQD